MLWRKSLGSGYILALDCNEQSKQMVHSNRLVEYCRSKGKISSAYILEKKFFYNLKDFKMTNNEKINFFIKNGYLLIEDVFHEKEVQIMKDQIEKVKNTPGVIYERICPSSRSLNGVHQHNCLMMKSVGIQNCYF